MNATDVRRYLSRTLDRLTWLHRAIIVGALITILWMEYTRPGLNARLVGDGLLFGVVPLTFGLAHGRNIGWQVDRKAVVNSLLLAAFVVPFYVVGSSLPTVRAYYPIWSTGTDPAVFVPHALKLFTIALATETYYRGLLCVGVGEEVGWKAAFISPLVYAFHHISKPPIELVLSGPTDVLFGLVDYNADSLLPSVVAHGAGLVLLDWLVLHDPIIPTETVIQWLQWIPLPL